MSAKSGELVRWLMGAVASATLAVLIASGPARAADPVADWQQTGVKSFHGLEGTTKSQGLASDGSRMFFSWNLGLHSTGLDMGLSLAENLTGIPHDLSIEGSNHIGDIDYYDGRIYAPIEAGPAYLKSYIVPYDAETLQAGPERYLLDHDKLTKGVPWVAIDADRQVAYTGEWNNLGVLNVHRLSDFQITSTVALDQPVPRIQGAKMYKGFLYAARDNGAEKSIDAIDPITGHVTHLFDRNLGNDHEAEGIAFVRNSGGTTMRTADIDESDGGRVDIHSYRIGGDLTSPRLGAIKVLSGKLWPGSAVKFRLSASEDVTGEAGWSRCIGSRRHPCRRTSVIGPAPELSLRTGVNTVRLATRKGYAPKGKVLGPGRYRLTITPADIADAEGKPVSATLRIFAPGR